MTLALPIWAIGVLAALVACLAWWASANVGRKR